MTRAPVLMQFGTSADFGQVAVSYRDLYPGHAERPTDTDPNDAGVPYTTLQLLNICGEFFLPVYPGMWFGAYVYYCNMGSIMAPVTLRRKDDGYTQNLWRATTGTAIEADPDRLEDSLAWEVSPYRGITIANQVDRDLRRDGDPNGGRFNPFVVSDTNGIPAIPDEFNELTIWRRNLRTLAGAKSVDDPIARGTGKFAQNAVMANRVTLMWRDTAEQIIRGAGLIADGDPIPWTQL